MLYGSHVHGTETTDSDVDVAVGFEESVPESERLDRRVDLVGDRDTLEGYRDRFEREQTAPETHEERIQRFDALLDRLEETV